MYNAQRRPPAASGDQNTSNPLGQSGPSAATLAGQIASGTMADTTTSVPTSTAADDAAATAREQAVRELAIAEYKNVKEQFTRD